MNKSNLSQAVHDVHGGMSYANAVKVVDAIFDIIKQRLAGGEKVLISGFGCFRVVTRKDRKGVNPQSGNAIVIRGRKAVVFKPSKYLKSI